MSADKTGFLPHKFAPGVQSLPKVAPLRLPKIILSRQAYAKMWTYVAESEEEVGWLGTAIRSDCGDIAIEKVFLFKQTVSPVETEISTEGLAEFADELIANHRDGMEDWSNMRFWGHSHVRMGTNPSSTDENTMVRSTHTGQSLLCFQDAGYDFAVRGIFNKFGRAQFSIFLYAEGLRIDDAEWTLADGDKFSSSETVSMDDPVDSLDVRETTDERPAQTISKYVPEISETLQAEIRAELALKVTSRTWRSRLHRSSCQTGAENMEGAPEAAPAPAAQAADSASSSNSCLVGCRCDKCAENVLCSDSNHLPTKPKRQVSLPAPKALVKEKRSTSVRATITDLIWRAMKSICGNG